MQTSSSDEADGVAPRPALTSGLGVAFAIAVIALAFVPGRTLDAGCDARNSLPGLGAAAADGCAPRVAATD